MAAGENLGFAGLQFQHHGASSSWFLAGCGPGVLRKFSDLGLRFGQQNILFEGVLGGDTSGVTFDAILNRQPVPAVRLNPEVS